jgi:hypothetical protein
VVLHAPTRDDRPVHVRILPRRNTRASVVPSPQAAPNAAEQSASSSTPELSPEIAAFSKLMARLRATRRGAAVVVPAHSSGSSPAAPKSSGLPGQQPTMPSRAVTTQQHRRITAAPKARKAEPPEPVAVGNRRADSKRVVVESGPPAEETSAKGKKTKNAKKKGVRVPATRAVLSATDDESAPTSRRQHSPAAAAAAPSIDEDAGGVDPTTLFQAPSVSDDVRSWRYETSQGARRLIVHPAPDFSDHTMMHSPEGKSKLAALQRSLGLHNDEGLRLGGPLNAAARPKRTPELPPAADEVKRHRQPLPTSTEP